MREPALGFAVLRGALRSPPPGRFRLPGPDRSAA